MLSIGVCDDEVQTCMELEQMLYTYGKNRKLDLHVNVWNKGEDLCSFLEKGDTLQILFLDIELITMNGVQIGDFIRNKLDNYEMSIIYISSKTEYVMQLFKMTPLDFLVKPLNYGMIEEVMDRGLHKESQKNRVFEVKRKSNRIRVPLKDVKYFYSENKKVIIVTGTEKIDFNGKLKEVQKHVSENFLMIHQSFLINKEYVGRYSYEEVVMQDGEILPVSQTYRKNVRKQLLGSQ